MSGTFANRLSTIEGEKTSQHRKSVGSGTRDSEGSLAPGILSANRRGAAETLEGSHLPEWGPLDQSETRGLSLGVPATLDTRQLLGWVEIKRHDHQPHGR